MTFIILSCSSSTAENNVTCDDLPEDLLAFCSDSDGALDMLIEIELGGE